MSPHAVVKCEKKNGGYEVERELEGGALQVYQLPMPCLLGVQTGMNQVRYASLKGIMAAKKKPFDVKTAADLGLAGQVGAGGAKMSIEKVYVPPKGEGAEMIEGSAAEIAEALIGKIRELGVL